MSEHYRKSTEKSHRHGSTSDGAGPQGAASTVPQLQCQSCSSRKVKCDKLRPCTNCVAAGVVCVPVRRMRLPRGRHARRSGEPGEDLMRRVRRLESLINKAGPVDITSDTVTQRSPQVSSISKSHQRPSTVILFILHLRHGALKFLIAARLLLLHDSDRSSHPVAPDRSDQRASLLQQPQHFWADLAEEVRYQD